MKKLILLLPLLLASCEALYSPQQEEQIVQIEEQMADTDVIGAALRAELETIEDPELRAQVLAALTELEASQNVSEAELAAIEQDALEGQYGPLIGALGALHPALAGLSPLLLGLVPLFGRRGRKHFGKALAHINPFQREDGIKRTAPIRAATSLLKMIGALHSETDDLS